MQTPISLHFNFRTLKEAKTIATTLSEFYPDPRLAFYGLNELMINAVEHGNLGIGCSKKAELVRSGLWHMEIDKRLAMKQNANKIASVTCNITPETITVHIKDKGEGFDWRPYLELSPDVFALNGRGIATARSISFPSMQYMGKGNEVVCVVKREAGALQPPLKQEAGGR